MVRQLRRLLPGEDIVYLGDTARLPYGSRSREEIVLFNRQIISWLVRQGVKMVLMGCNTSSALALDWAKQNFSLPISGLISAGAAGACRATKNRRVGVLATQATVGSHAYQNAIGLLRPDIRVTGSACPLFVSLIENGQTSGPEVRSAAQGYLAPLLAAGTDTIIYGCTHYPLLGQLLKDLAGPGKTFIDPAELAAAEVKEELNRERTAPDGQSERPAGTGRTAYWLTGPADNFRRLLDLVLPEPDPDIRHLELAELTV